MLTCRSSPSGRRSATGSARRAAASRTSCRSRCPRRSSRPRARPRRAARGAVRPARSSGPRRRRRRSAAGACGRRRRRGRSRAATATLKTRAPGLRADCARPSRRARARGPVARAIRVAAALGRRDERAPLEQVPRRVAADGELRKEHDVGALRLRAAAGCEDLLGVAGEVADRRVDLGDGDAKGTGHGSSSLRGRAGGVKKRPGRADRPAVVIASQDSTSRTSGRPDSRSAGSAAPDRAGRARAAARARPPRARCRPSAGTPPTA